ncbi:MAG: chromosome partitioning protein ParA [Tychonema bourrellyi B0820]|uniref:Chromosome partitioning protein ParA n=2 Tax=Tychonema bourrellyi TaxID=54313 RepID=A0A2G4F4Q2_9CYAN|nr:chromosome partitioning protein ParA [Tychonema bourrellyi B0820]PHX56705.1 chromosome partitioning protein ParA [Tychonema bourrellyi FEM_GT703]
MKSIMLSEQPVILEKPAVWSRLFLWMIMLMTTSAVVWAYFASIEQAVPAVGQLELKDGARDIQAPATGAVVRVHVENGDRVEKNQPLLTFNPVASSADFTSIKKTKEALEKENKFYEDVVNGKIQGAIPSNLESTIKDRQSLTAQNQVLQALIDELYLNRGASGNFDATQQGLYVNYKSEFESRVAAAQGQVQELEKQFQQAQDAEKAAAAQMIVAQQQFGFAQNQLNYSQQQLASSQEQIKSAVAQKQLADEQLGKSQQVLKSNQGILSRLTPLVEAGAIAELQKERQEQDVFRGQSEVLKQQDQIKQREGEINSRKGEINTRLGEINTRRGEINARQGDIQKITAEVQRQQGEQGRIQESIKRAQEQLKNTKDAWAKELYSKIAENQKQIASSDSQLSRFKVENLKKLSEINGQLQKAQETRDTQVLKSPVSGVIFDLKPSKKENAKLDIAKDPICQSVIKSVVKPGEPRPARCEEAYYEAQQTEKLLKVLDDENGLQAIVYLENSNVALILEALKQKRSKLEQYHGKQLDGEKIHCEKGKSCVCPEKEVNREKLGLTKYQCVPVEVNVEAFPAMEFGTAQGEVIEISSDALAPTELRKYYAFKTTIKLKNQKFVLNKDKPNQLEVNLQSGMSVSSNINIGKRTVLQMFINRFTGKLDTFKSVK